MSFPTDIWTQDDPGRTDNPNLYLNENWGLSVARMLVGSDWSVQASPITGAPENQLDFVYGNGQRKAVMRLSPDYTGATVPLETTITQYLSRQGYYDMYVDQTLNRLADVDKPVYGMMMVATDGQPLPMYFLHSSTNYGATFTKHVEMNPSDGIWRFSERVGLTPEGGIAVNMLHNITTPAKGQVVRASTAGNETVSLINVDGVDPFGVVYNGVPDSDGRLWIVVSGMADVLFINTAGVTRRQFARVLVAADSAGTPVAGSAVGETAPTPPLATDKHFQEIGHIVQTTTGPGLARTVLHFN